jgi:hypothetical protein
MSLPPSAGQRRSTPQGPRGPSGIGGSCDQSVGPGLRRPASPVTNRHDGRAPQHRDAPRAETASPRLPCEFPSPPKRQGKGWRLACDLRSDLTPRWSGLIGMVVDDGPAPTDGLASGWTLAPHGESALTALFLASASALLTAVLRRFSDSSASPLKRTALHRLRRERHFAITQRCGAARAVASAGDEACHTRIAQEPRRMSLCNESLQRVPATSPCPPSPQANSSGKAVLPPLRQREAAMTWSARAKGPNRHKLRLGKKVPHRETNRPVGREALDRVLSSPPAGLSASKPPSAMALFPVRTGASSSTCSAEKAMHPLHSRGLSPQPADKAVATMECARGKHHELTDMAARASTGPDCRGGDRTHSWTCGRVHVPPRPVRNVESMVLVLEQLSMGCNRGANRSGRRLHTPTCARINDRPSDPRRSEQLATVACGC